MVVVSLVLLCDDLVFGCVAPRWWFWLDGFCCWCGFWVCGLVLFGLRGFGYVCVQVYCGCVIWLVFWWFGVSTLGFLGRRVLCGVGII